MTTSRLNLYRAQPVLVGVVTVRGFQRKRAVGVSFPTAAEIHRVVNPADLILPADAQRDGIILSIADIRKPDLPHDRRIERAWRAEAVNAQGIVAAVLASPLAMIDQTRRNRL